MWGGWQGGYKQAGVGEGGQQMIVHSRECCFISNAHKMFSELSKTSCLKGNQIY